MANIAETAKQAGQFTTLLAAVEAAGLGGALTGQDKLTVFAPTDVAFAKLPAGTVEGLLKDIPALTKILTYHVVAGTVSAQDVMKLKLAKTLEGSNVAIDITDGVKINKSRVTTADVNCDNGVIHIIDTVLLPA